MTDEPTTRLPPPRRSGCLKGAAVGCLMVLLLAGLAGYFLVDIYKKYMDRYAREGYKRVEQQYIEINERLDEPTIFVGQVVKVRRGSSRGIGLLCQTAEIEGEVVGNVHFVGQILTVGKKAHLRRDLDVKAQVLNVYGVVDGKITGIYQTLNRKPPTALDAQPLSETNQPPIQPQEE